MNDKNKSTEQTFEARPDELRSENTKLKRKATRATNEARACEARLRQLAGTVIGVCNRLDIASTVSGERLLAVLDEKLTLLAEYERTKTTLKSIVSEGIVDGQKKAENWAEFVAGVYELLGLDENIALGIALDTLEGRLKAKANDVVFVTPNDLQKKILTFLKLDPATATAEDVATAFVAISDKLMAYALIQKGLHELLGLPSRQDDAMLLSNVREKINAASHYSRLCGTLAEIRNALHLPTEATTDAILAAVVHNRKEAADAAADAYLDAGEARLIETLVTLLQLDADMENDEEDEELASPVEAVTDAVADLLHDRNGLNEQTKKLARELADVRADRDRAFARDREQAARIDDQDEQLRSLRLQLVKLASTAALLGEEAQRVLRQASER